MKRRGVLIKFIGEETMQWFPVDESFRSLADIEFDCFEEGEKFIYIPYEHKNTYINLERVEYIDFVFE